jgi:hypothetical protein
MVIRWRALPFTHIANDGSGCGKEATILEICVSSDGCICVTGVCATCGEQFSTPEMVWADIMRSVSIKDYKDGLLVGKKTEIDLDNFVPVGRPC